MSMNSQDQLFATKTLFKYCKIVPNSLIFNTKALFKLVIQNQFLKVCCLDNSLCLEYILILDKHFIIVIFILVVGLTLNDTQLWSFPPRMWHLGADQLISHWSVQFSLFLKYQLLFWNTVNVWVHWYAMHKEKFIIFTLTCHLKKIFRSTFLWSVFFS